MMGLGELAGRMGIGVFVADTADQGQRLSGTIVSMGQARWPYPDAVLAAEAPKITDWMQAWGSIASLILSAVAVTFTGLLFRHEIRVRREEKTDAEAAQARLVIGTLCVQEGGENPIGYAVVNYSSEPILDVHIRYAWADGLTLVRRLPVLDRESRGDLPLHGDVEEIQIFYWLDLIFTDANGRKWRRVDKLSPRRIVEERKYYSDPSIVLVGVISLAGMTLAYLSGSALASLFL